MEASPQAALEAIIREVINELLEMTVTPHVRELRAKAVTYGRVIHSWSTYPPTGPQVQAMHECVNELRDKVLHAKRSDVSRVSRKPSAPMPELSRPGGWSASVNDTGVHARGSRRSLTPPPERGTPTTRPPAAYPPPGSSPPGRGATPTTVPPVSAPRATIDTPTPALLRSRRSR